MQKNGVARLFYFGDWFRVCLPLPRSHDNLCSALIHFLDVQKHHSKDHHQYYHGWYDDADGHKTSE